jgi:hypothetical protein
MVRPKAYIDEVRAYVHNQNYSRKHAQSILDIPMLLGGMNLWPAFEQVWAPEEVFLPTALAVSGNLVGVSQLSLTHSEWDVLARDHKDRAHPILYDGNFDDVLVSRTRAKRCLFLSKVKRPLDLSVWECIFVRRKRGRDAGTNTGMTQTWTDSMRGRDNGAEREMD